MTVTGNGIKTVLRKGHSQDVAHLSAVEEAEPDPETALYSVASLTEVANPEPSLKRMDITGTDGMSQSNSDVDGFKSRTKLETPCL